VRYEIQFLNEVYISNEPHVTPRSNFRNTEKNVYDIQRFVILSAFTQKYEYYLEICCIIDNTSHYSYPYAVHPVVNCTYVQ